MFWDAVDTSVSLPSDKPLDIQQISHSVLQAQPFTAHQVISFLGKANFLATVMHNYTHCAASLQGNMLNTICCLLGRSMAQQSNIHKIVQPSIYILTLSIKSKENKENMMLPPKGNSLWTGV